MSISFILILVVCLVTGIIGKEDFAIIGDFNKLYTRPMSSDILTEITGLGYLGTLYDVDYDQSTDQIYWASATQIGRCKSDGSNQQTVIQNPTHNGQSCTGFYSIQLNLDTSHIFWVTNCGSENVLQRANLDGTSVTTLGQKANADYSSTEISLDRSTGDIYWSLYYPGDVHRVTPSGIITTVINRGWTNGASVAFEHPDTLYWTQYSPDNIIFTSDTDGQNEETFYTQTGYHNADQLNLYKDVLYFIQAGDPDGRRIFYMKKDGSQSTPTKDTTVDFAPSCLHIHEDSVPSARTTEATEKPTTPVMTSDKPTTLGRTTAQRTTITKTTSSGAEEDFAIVGSSTELYTRPMSSSTLTRLNLGSLGILYDVDYDQSTDQIYWASDTQIGRCKSDGSNQQTVMQNPTHNGQSCTGFYSIQLNLDTNHIFWVTKCGSENVLQRANLDGTSVITLGQAANAQSSWTEISLDQSTGDIYWSVYDQGDIYRVTPSGTNTTVVDRGWSNGASVVFDPTGTLYWTQYSPDNILFTSDTDGQNEENFYTQEGYHNADQLNLYKDELYFIQAGDPAGRRIFYMKKDGSQATPTKDTTVDFAPSCLHIYDAPGEDPVMAPGKPTATGKTTDQHKTLTKTTSSGGAKDASSKGIPLGGFEFGLIGLTVVVIILITIIFFLVRRRMKNSDETKDIVEKGNTDAAIPDNDDGVYASIPENTGNERPLSGVSGVSNASYEQSIRLRPDSGMNNNNNSVIIDVGGAKTKSTKDHRYDEPPCHEGHHAKTETMEPAHQAVYSNTLHPGVKKEHVYIATPDMPRKQHITPCQRGRQGEPHQPSEDIVLRDVVHNNQENEQRNPPQSPDISPVVGQAGKQDDGNHNGNGETTTESTDESGRIRLGSGEPDEHHLWHALTTEGSCFSLEFVRDDDDDDVS